MRHGGARALRAALAGAALLAALPVAPARALVNPDTDQEFIDIKTLEVTRSTTQAGAHPNVRVLLEFCEQGRFWKTDPRATVCWPRTNFNPKPWHERINDLVVRTPPGLLGNTLALPLCEYEDVLRFIKTGPLVFKSACPEETRVGVSYGIAQLGPGVGDRALPGEIYNVRPTGSEPARFGAFVTPGPVPGRDQNAGDPAVWQPTTFRVRSDGDFGLDSLTPHIQRSLEIGGMKPLKIKYLEMTFPGVLPSGRPFMTNPTSCAPASVTAEANSHETPSYFATKETQLAPTTGCDAVPFDPWVDIAPETDKAGAPSGYTIGVNFPNSEDDPIHQAHLKHAEVTLPEGVVLSPTAAHELEGCTEAEFGPGTNDPVSCPAASEIGDVTVETPILDTDLSTPEIDPLTGKVYFARPTDADPWRMFIAIEGGGMLVKLTGKIELDQQTGRITTKFGDDQPQLPFTRFEMRLRGGDHAVLQNPTTCGTYQISAKLTPWSDDGSGARAVTKTGDFTISGDGQGGPCASPTPFAPSITGSTSPRDAGAATSAHMVIERPDGHQLIKSLNMTLPPGLIGSLATVPQCPAAAARAGICSEASKIGTLAVDVGAGATPIRVPGELFLAEPLVAGDTAGLSVVVPARTGPIDLGKVVVTNRVRVRPTDAAVEVLTGELPPILEGVPLPMRRIDIDVNREGFMRNGTSCAPKTLSVDFLSHGGAQASAGFTDSATNCNRLPFSPRLRLIAGGSRALTKGSTPPTKLVHPTLRAIVTQPAGQANIASSRVILPWILRPDLPRLQQPGALCQDDQVATRTCPANSRVGWARANSPLLPMPLQGPVYIVQQFEPSNPLPRLTVFLDGIASVRLDSQNRFLGGTDPRERIRTTNTFTGIPDVPITRFELTIDGGPNGLLNNWRDLCENPDTFDASFSSHSGRSVSYKPKLEVDGCAGAVGALSIRTRSATMTRSGRVKVRLRCASGKRCKGRLTLKTRGRVRISRKRARRRKLTLGRRSFSIPAGQTRTVRVKLTRKGRRIVRRSKRLRVRVTAKIDSQTVRRTIRVKAPKRRRAGSRRGRR